VIWTDPYIFFTSRQPGLTVATKSTDLRGVRRVIGMDFGIANLGDFARQIKVGPSGSTIITAGDGAVIAAPDLDARITEDRDGRPVLPHLDAFPPPIPALAEPMEKAQVGAVQSISEVGSGSGKTAVAVTKVPVGKGVWSVALYGPASEFATSATQTGRRGLVKIILLGVVALCLAMILAAALTRPLGGLALSAASDGLTGLANRRELESVGGMLFQRSQAGARMLSVAIVDVDRFKEINDTHGHLAGDDVLRTIADALSAAVRRDDVVGRFAGDEFVIVMPDAGGPEAQAVANRALEAVRQFPLPTKVTASAGVATLTKEHVTFSDLLAASDRALYRAKQLGRDRVVREGDLSVSAQDD
jgi:diguanylate cyclase (GGDEF)-like protein